MKNRIQFLLANSQLVRLRPGCENKHDTCKAWANAGECKKNPGFMLADCKFACKACAGMDAGTNALYGAAKNLRGD